MRAAAAILAAVAASGAIAACGSSKPETKSAEAAGKPVSASSSKTATSGGLKGTVTIGAVLPLTGPNASLGVDEQRGAELATEEVNSTGGALGKQLKVIVEDSEGQAPATVSAAKKLVSVDHVPVVIGAHSSGNTIPMAQYLQQQHVIHLNCCSSSPEIAKIGDFSFSTIGLDTLAGKFTASQVYKELGKHSISLLAPNNAYGIGVIDVVEKTFKEDGGTVATKVLYTEGQSEYRQDLERINAAKAEMLVYTAYGKEAEIINKESYELGMNPHTFYGIYMTENVIDSEPRATDGQVGMEVNYIGGPTGRAYEAAYKKKYGFGFKTGFSGYVYDDVMLAVKAMNQAKSTSPEAIRKQLVAIGNEGYQGVTGEIKWDPQGQRIAQPYLFDTVVNGKVVPATIQNGKAVPQG